MDKTKKLKKYIILMLCGIAGSAIYRLPFLRETYYEALMQATGSTNAQLGMLMSAYGIVNLILYLPGGWAADKFSARNLMTFSLVSTGVTGFYFATFPPFPIILLLHGLWAITTVFTFWAACIKVVRELGDSSEQGKLFGFWYLGKGLTATILGFITVPLFANFGEGVSGLRATIIFYSIVSIVTGILCWIFIPKKEPVSEGETEAGFSFKDAVSVFKMPAVWLAGLASFCMWSIYIGFGYITPYFTDVFSMGESQVAIISIIRANVLFAAGGLIGGKLADKCKTKSKFMVYAFIGMIVLTMVYIFMPGESGMLVPAVINMIALGSFIYCANAVFFSLIDEANVPAKLTGTAAGLISLVAYVPDVYLYTVLGNVLDSNPGVTGYRYVFIFMVVCAVIGLIASATLHKMNYKKLKSEN
jgi:putative transporter cgxT